MIDFEEIRNYLPQYLSTESQRKLFEDLKKSPDNLDDSYYSWRLTNSESYYQGDGIKQLLVMNLPEPEIGKLPSIILSNSCDIDPNNRRLFESRISYAPIFQLEKYKNALIKDHVETKMYKMDAINDHIQNVVKQLNTQILYLPKGCGLENDSIVFLDRINNCPIEELNKCGEESCKLFSLSNYGFYVFLIKLSIHFNRIQEGIDRTEIVAA